ncbi:MAG: DUF2835 domain-containing protein [Cellvibrionaceae bacterium]|nr:DUF2835 domain-containing protein [Cellvibrionaceae bacterium]
MASRQLHVSLAIAADEYLRLYRGSARSVLATSWSGKRVRFPANILQPYVTREGVHGHFIISFDSDHRFQKIEKLAEY